MELCSKFNIPAVTEIRKKINELQNNINQMMLKDLATIQTTLNLPDSVVKILPLITTAKDSHSFNKIWAVST